MTRDISKYVRVTQILSIFQAYAHVPSQKLKRAQDIGTDIHAAIESYYRGDFEPLGLRRTPYFESFLCWEGNVGAKPILLEERLFNDNLMVTGKLDLLADIGGKALIIDFKTGQWTHREIWELQLHWYWFLLSNTEKLPKIEKFLVVQLVADGSAPILHEFDIRIEALEMCMRSYECWKYFNKGLVSN